jgi:hypothetical protein
MSDPVVDLGRVLSVVWLSARVHARRDEGAGGDNLNLLKTR